MKFQDIQSNNFDQWRLFVTYMKANDFTNAIKILDELRVNHMTLTASELNLLFGAITDTESLSDPTFKSTKIQTTPTVPATLDIGQMYFKEYV